MHWGKCMEHFVHINGQIGLTHRDRCKAADMLNKGGNTYEEENV
jgi:hypothetical protein